MTKPLIFITNDDGVNAKGFRLLIDVAARYGRVVAIAPAEMQSGKSNAITMYQPLFLKKVVDEPDKQIYSLTGTPVDCAKMAFDNLLLGEKVDLALSGINHGSNAGINVLYSGTMGAAMEGSFYGCPSVGLSLDDHDLDADFDGALEVAAMMIEKMLGTQFDEQVCLNVNVPAVRPEELKGVRICRQTRGFWREEYDCRQDPRGNDYFWLHGAFCNAEPDAEQTDEWALKNGYVTVVPVKIDMTNYGLMDRLKGVL